MQKDLQFEPLYENRVNHWVNQNYKNLKECDIKRTTLKNFVGPPGLEPGTT